MSIIDTFQPLQGTLLGVFLSNYTAPPSEWIMSRYFNLRMMRVDICLTRMSTKKNAIKKLTSNHCCGNLESKSVLLPELEEYEEGDRG